MLYFGCWGDTGHYLFDKHGRTLRGEKNPLPSSIYPKIDCGFLPQGKRTPHNGVSSLEHVDGWTIISFRDNTVDTRPGSHSTFVEKGILCFDEMVAKAKAEFPSIWSRFAFGVRLA